MSNTAVLKSMRIPEWIDEELNKASEQLEIKKCELARFLLNNAMRKLKEDSIKAGGYDKLEISIVKSNKM